MTLDFPLGALALSDVALALDYHTRPGQQATNAMQRSRGYSGAQFRIAFKVLVHDTQTARAVRGLLANMEADTQLVRLRMPDLYGIDGPYAIATAAARAAYPLGIPFATDALYATGVGHAYPTLEATVFADAALGDREIYATVDTELPGGCAISINEFCYYIAGSWTETDGSNRLKLSPPLRLPVVAGDIVSLAPVFVGACVTETPGYESTADGGYVYHAFEFVEDLTRIVEDVD